MYWSLWAAAICTLPYPLAVHGRQNLLALSLQGGVSANAFSCLQESASQTPDLPSGRCLEKYQKVWRESVKAKCLRISQTGADHQTQENSTYIFWKRSITATEPCFPLLTQWDFCPCLLSEQGHTLKLIHQSLDKFCGNRETSHNDWSWCWRCLVQTYVAAHVPKKLLVTVREQQPIPDPGSRGDEGNVTRAPGCLGAPRSQSRSSAGAKVGLERNKTVLNKRQDLSHTTYQTIRFECRLA